MRHRFVLAALLSIGLSLAPALAQDTDAPVAPVPEGQDTDQGQSLMERGARMFLEGMRREMEPALEDLRDLMVEMGPAMQQFMRDMGPALADLLGRIDDLSAYQAPELLPNGDILIRRKPESGPLPPPAEGEIDI